MCFDTSVSIKRLEKYQKTVYYATSYIDPTYQDVWGEVRLLSGEIRAIRRNPPESVLEEIRNSLCICSEIISINWNSKKYGYWISEERSPDITQNPFLLL
jgi:hypothetical protein